MVGVAMVLVISAFQAVALKASVGGEGYEAS